MWKALWKKISDIGIKPSLPVYLAYRVRLTNQALALIALVCVLITLSSLGSVLALASGTALLFTAGIYLGIYAGAYNLARLAVMLFGTLVIVSPSLLSTPPGVLPPISTFTLSLGLSAIAFVLFAPQEQAQLFIALGTVWVIVFATPFLSGVFPPLIDFAEYNSFSRQLLRIVVSFAFLTGALWLLQRTNVKIQAQAQAALDKLAAEQTLAAARQTDLERTLAELETARQADRDRQWASEGMNQFSQLFRQQSDDPYPRLISQLVKYLGANQGALYLAETDAAGTRWLRMVGAYAWDRQKFHQQRLPWAHGLVGQAVQEQAPLVLTKVPADYIAITSSLGEAPPTALAIVPLVHNGAVAGAVELAAFQPFTERHLHFLQQLGEELAANLINQQNTARTRQLLEQADAQKQQLQAQEEEMRQNMEEMQATQEEHLRREQAHLARIAELEAQLRANADLVG
ncbi:MAG: GAF domain-containing protein [Bernardetiaceae bacterium]|nr:GAF domain-containing protein [Bernardetiaceae bacterium]